MVENTRQKLLQVGRRLIATNGYAQTTVGEIEQAAGLTPRAGGFYRHFKNKEALLLAIAAEALESPEKLGITDMFPLGDTRSELVFIARAYDRLNDSPDGMSSVIRAESGRIPELKKMIGAANDQLAKALVDWVAEKPAFKRKPRTVATEMAFMIFGGWLFYLSRRDELGDPPLVRSEKLLTRWSEFWAQVLDGKRAGI